MSPTGTVVVYSGHHLELTCATTGQVLRWKFALINENGTNHTYFEQSLQYLGSADLQLFNRTFNSSVFFINRTSGANVLPVMSRLSIIPVTNALNQTVIYCEDVATRMSSSTTINVISSNLLPKSQGILL